MCSGPLLSISSEVDKVKWYRAILRWQNHCNRGGGEGGKKESVNFFSGQDEVK